VTDPERTAVAESLLMVIFALRADDTEASQAWVLSIATTAMSRAILASVGPGGNPAELLALSADQVAAAVTTAQSKFFRDRIAAKVRA
jgi:hypothetical protein